MLRSSHHSPCTVWILLSTLLSCAVVRNQPLPQQQPQQQPQPQQWSGVGRQFSSSGVDITPFWLRSDASLPGRSCSIHAECGENGRCINGQCGCYSTYVLVNQRCLPKIKPGQSPCSANEQCSSFWPDTQCINTLCQCQRGIHVKTKDGMVCAEFDRCPLGGSAAVLKAENGSITTCDIDPRSGESSGCLNQMHMYECIKDKPTSRGYCCPTKANTCSQTPDSGSYGFDGGGGGSRWFYDFVGGDCRQFNYAGSGGNANNFASRDHCENYCKTTCNRGSPMYRKAYDPFIQATTDLEQLCDPNSGCSDSQFACDVLQPGRSLCCPSRAFVCGSMGGVTRFSGQPFDEGIYCSENRTTSTRWYFDDRTRQCQAFTYRGCSGNFNNFRNREDCQSICAQESSRALIAGRNQQPSPSTSSFGQGISQGFTSFSNPIPPQSGSFGGPAIGFTQQQSNFNQDSFGGQLPFNPFPSQQGQFSPSSMNQGFSSSNDVSSRNPIVPPWANPAVYKNTHLFTGSNNFESNFQTSAAAHQPNPVIASNPWGVNPQINRQFGSSGPSVVPMLPPIQQQQQSPAPFGPAPSPQLSSQSGSFSSGGFSPFHNPPPPPLSGSSFQQPLPAPTSDFMAQPSSLSSASWFLAGTQPISPPASQMSQQLPFPQSGQGKQQGPERVPWNPVMHRASYAQSGIEPLPSAFMYVPPIQQQQGSGNNNRFPWQSDHDILREIPAIRSNPNRFPTFIGYPSDLDDEDDDDEKFMRQMKVASSMFAMQSPNEHPFAKQR